MQNQTGRFPKKWDKTGKVVENQDHDKVLVKLDGSGRLTTRNRRFVKKIVSPPDLSQTDVLHPQSLVPVCDDDDGSIPNVGRDDVPEPIVDSGVMGDEVPGDQIRHDSQSNEGGDTIENGVRDIITREDPVLNDRPKRDRKQNVRYSSQEYDLSSVTHNPGKEKLMLSSIYVQTSSGKLMKKNINKRK